MHKNHGCLWYIFIFPIVAPFYLSYLIMCSIPKFFRWLISLGNSRTTYRVPNYNFQNNQYMSSTNYYSCTNMTGHSYEYMCADYLRAKGFVNVNVTKGSGDQGADIIAWKDGLKYAVQCKYYQSPVGNKAVQEVFSAKTYYACNMAMVITNNTFTKSAVELAGRTGVILYPYIHDVTVNNAISQANRVNSFTYNALDCNETVEVTQPVIINKPTAPKKVKPNKKYEEILQYAKECNAYVEREEKKYND